MDLEEHIALTYLRNILSDDNGDILSYSLTEFMVEIFASLPDIDPSSKEYLKQRCRTVKHLKQYLKQHKDLFWIENGMVAPHYEGLEEERERAVGYFEGILEDYTDPPNIKNFYGHNGQAEDETVGFLSLFYPGPGQFKQFLLNHPEVFVIFSNDTVCLIEDEAVKYFETCVEEDREGWHYMNLRECIGQAPNHVMNFINNYYPGEFFLEFLENNSDVFVVEEEHVYLN